MRRSPISWHIIHDVEQVPRLDLRPGVLLRQGWAFIKPHYFVIITVQGLLAAFNVLMDGLSFFGVVASVLVNSVGISGLIWYVILAHGTTAPNWRDMLEPMRQKPLEILITASLTGVFVLAGLIAFVLPGLYAAMACMLALPFVMLAPVSPLRAVGLSGRVVNRQLGEFVALWLTCLGANLVGALLFGVGLFISVPATWGAYALLIEQVFGIHAYAEATAQPIAPIQSGQSLISEL